jgi:hypothetical protein
MNPFKIYIIGVCCGMLIPGYLVLTWDSKSDVKEYYAPTRESKNGNTRNINRYGKGFAGHGYMGSYSILFI